MTPIQPPPIRTNNEGPVTQEKPDYRKNWPVWMKQMPRLRFPPRRDDFELVDPKKLEEFLATLDPDVSGRILTDIKHMDYELLRLFRQRDYDAKLQQNRYYLFQIMYLGLATAAALVGSLLALALNARPDLVPWLGFAETVIALFTAYLASLSGRRPPMPEWLENRRKAEFLRREYFRYLMNLPPYEEVKGYQREVLLSRRAADINRGFFPDSDNQ
jgi:hypothetical protein